MKSRSRPERSISIMMDASFRTCSAVVLNGIIENLGRRSGLARSGSSPLHLVSIGEEHVALPGRTPELRISKLRVRGRDPAAKQFNVGTDLAPILLVRENSGVLQVQVRIERPFRDDDVPGGRTLAWCRRRVDSGRAPRGHITCYNT